MYEMLLFPGPATMIPPCCLGKPQQSSLFYISVQMFCLQRKWKEDIEIGIDKNIFWLSSPVLILGNAAKYLHMSQS